MLTEVVRQTARLGLDGLWRDLRAEIETRLLLVPSGLHPPLIARQLLVSGEDHRSARHGGFDVIAMLRAAWRCVFFGKREGASTIEQQLVRVLTNRFELTLNRKCREILLASRMAEVLTKADIAGLYLTTAYYGWGMNNFHEACSRLGFSPIALSLDEAAELVARLKYPEPRVMSEKRRVQIERRRAHLLRLFEKHRSDGTYEHLTQSAPSKALQGRALSARPPAAVSPA